jgi:hypothetical protein
MCGCYSRHRKLACRVGIALFAVRDYPEMSTWLYNAQIGDVQGDARCKSAYGRDRDMARLVGQTGGLSTVAFKVYLSGRPPETQQTVTCAMAIFQQLPHEEQ